MSIIVKECIVFDIAEKTKDEVIKKLVIKLKEINAIIDADTFFEDVMERERICATAIGNDIGLPHVRTTNVLKTSICFGRLAQSIIWNEENHEKAKYIILIAIPEKDASQIHLKMISMLARQLMHEEYRSILLNGTKEEIFCFFNSSVII